MHERTLVRTTIIPDPAAVKWINPNVTRGEERDIVVTVGEAGGIWALDRATGQFLWAMPFPVDVPNFHISDIELTTGKTTINANNMFRKEGDRSSIASTTRAAIGRRRTIRARTRSISPITTPAST